MRSVQTRAEIRRLIAAHRAGHATGSAPGAEAERGVGAAPEERRGRVVLVPTMGALHEGHLSLLDRACERGDLVVLSIFVNPLQFGPSEDFASYPRDLDRDLALAAERGADLVFAPDVREIYPTGEPATRVVPGPMADRLCGAFRTGHFEGVLTVVAKLFNIVQPDVAVFGQKDYQQSVLIRRMVTDLDMPIEIDVAPTVRDPDGLALSSRNAYLSGDDRERALRLWRGLRAAKAAYHGGERDAAVLRSLAQAELEGDPRVRPQYVELVDGETLEPVAEAVPGSVLAVAAFVGDARLIDNLIFG